MQAKLPELAKCLRKLLEAGQICLRPSGKEQDEWFGTTTRNRTNVWSGNYIQIRTSGVNDASGGSASGPNSSTPNVKFKILMAALAHEAVHASDPADHIGEDGKQSNKEKKEEEQEATELELAILKDCGLGDSKRYNALRAWLKELCIWAEQRPDETPARDCQYVKEHHFTLDENGDPITGPYTIGFSAVGSAFSKDFATPEDPSYENSIFVTESLDYSGTVATGVAYPTVLAAYDDRPLPDQITLVTVGLDDQEQETVLQLLVFSAEGELLSSGPTTTLPGIHVVNGARDTAYDRLFLLSIPEGTIRTLVDTDGDHVPDSLSSTVFASRSTFPEIDECQFLEHGPGNGVMLARGNPRTLSLNCLRTELTDTDDDGVADVAIAYTVKERLSFAPTIGSELVDGATTLESFGTLGSTIQVWLTNADGEPLAWGVPPAVIPLGSATVSPADNRAIIPLGRALVTGEYVMLVDDTLHIEAAPAQVEAP